MWLTDLFRSATFRLAVLFALAVTASTSVVFLFIYWQVAAFDIERLNVRLVDEVAKAVSQPEDLIKRKLNLRLTDDLRRLDFAALFDRDGKPLYGNVAKLPEGLPVDGKAHIVEARRLRLRDAGIEPAVLVAGRRDDGGVLLLGRSLYEVYALRQLVIKALSIGIAPTVVLALITGMIFSLRNSRRLDAINQTIMRIMRGDLNERLPTRGRMDDLNSVASAVNLMLDEIVRLLNQIKSVGDNIAHDLRTPLTVMRARLERGLADSSEEALRTMVHRALKDLDHALATASSLLRISEIEIGRRPSGFKSMDLVDVCANVFELYQPLAEAKEISFTFESRDSIPILGDFDLLVEAVANLVDNALKFTPKGGSVLIVAKNEAGRAVVRVSDSGPGLQPSERSKIFKRFYRSPNSRDVPGTGLGLYMAAAIVKLHEFELRVDDNRPGAIFEILARPSGDASAL